MRGRGAPALAAVCGLLAAWGMVIQQRDLRRQTGQRADVVVAMSTMNRGDRVDGGRGFRVRTVPADLLPEGALRDTGELAGATLAAPLAAGAIVTQAALAPRGRVEATLQSGQRLIAVDVWLADGREPVPGERVDVIAAGETGGGFAELLVAGAQVLSLDAPTAQPVEDAPGAESFPTGAEATATLKVTLRQAARLMAARAGGARLAVLGRPGNERTAPAPVLERLRGAG